MGSLQLVSFPEVSLNRNHIGCTPGVLQWPERQSRKAAGTGRLVEEKVASLWLVLSFSFHGNLSLLNMSGSTYRGGHNTLQQIIQCHSIWGTPLHYPSLLSPASLMG